MTTVVPTARRPGTGPARRALVGYLAAQRDAIRANASGVRFGDEDAVHDMRVATRRLRSTLRTHRAVLKPWQSLRDELKWLAGVLGGVRDGDVMARRLGNAVAAEPPELVVGPVAARLRQRLAGETAEAQARLTAALDSPRYAALLKALDGMVAAGPTKRVGTGRLRRAARKALRRADARLDAGGAGAGHGGAGRAGAGAGAGRAGADAGRAEAGPSDTQLHEARKAYKRARYAVEVLRPVAGKPAKRLSGRLSALQDVLGTHQDAVVTADLLRAQAMRAFAKGENTFTYGLLHGRQQRAAEIARGNVARARDRATAGKARDWLS